jgi:hypothetical protein
MSKLYNATIIGSDGLAAWLTAAALASLDLRVALILDRAPDPEVPAFPWLPFPPERHAGLMSAAGLRPVAAPWPAFAPDFQVLIEGGVMDAVADHGHWERGLRREFQGMTPAFQERVRELDRLAAETLAVARERGFPYQSGVGNGNPLARLLGKAKQWAPGASVPFGQWAEGMTLGQSRAILAIAAAGLGAALPAEASALRVALLWGASRGLHAGPGGEQTLREQAAALIARRGVVVEAAPEALITRGKMARSVRFRGGAVLDAQLLIGNCRALAYLLREDEPAGPGPATTRTTWFFKFERNAIPESLAPRALLVRDPQRPLAGTNLMVLARSPRVPARETLAVTMFAPPSDLGAEDVPELMAAVLPWLEPSRLTVDDTREPVSAAASAADLAPLAWPRCPLENVFPLPSDLIPGWGPAGIALAIPPLTELCLELLKKYKARGWYN